ncbi:aldehyde dehydrogenase family protein [Pseudomonas sp. AN-1]|uniref:aldehyde dehydrogenase family protein n=1 Tax=Pseudomonas sp. AN-1 TaxID=3096605 RepID=UPI002A6B6DB6|nr:aldehyde dehydrogenase family protein [Pseudomonas sp. AN-1]WPP45538.1 aldehyde dehydrogenase family protein [Pseudomonas sp. AN-1]
MSQVTLLPVVKAFIAKGHGSFIDGQTQFSAAAACLPVIDPSTGQTMASVHSASAEDVDAAVASARKAFHGVWADTPPSQKGYLLSRLADLLEAHGEELAQLESLCSGKSIHVSRAIEVGQSAAFLRYYAGWASKINGETISPSFPSMAGERYSAFTLREPVGVVAGIVPWNFAVMIGIWKIASALVTGCTVVLKPSEYTPLTLLRIAELAIEAGIPAGVINVLTGDGAVGQRLTAHAGISKVSLTGSVATGKAVGKSAMDANLKRVTLELGGKNPAGLLQDVDADLAVAGLILGAYTHQGQICASPERIFVHRSRIDEVIDKMAKGLQQMKIGSPLDESVNFGPLANRAHYEKVLGFFNCAHAESSVICGGRAIERPGYFVEPTIVLAGNRDDRLLHEETFGPVTCFLPFDDDEELVDLMNDSPFGLTASIWTNNLSKAFRMVPRIEAGTVWINMHTFLDPAVPFGGVKGSGIGREFGGAFIDDYTELKSVILRY